MIDQRESFVLMRILYISKCLKLFNYFLFDLGFVYNIVVRFFWKLNSDGETDYFLYFVYEILKS